MTRAWSRIGLTALGISILALAGASAAHAGDLENGKLAYTTNCLTCHGEAGDGKGPVGVALQPPPRDFSTGDFVFDADKDGEKGSDADLVAVVKNGAMAYGGSPIMTPWAHLPEKDIQDVIAYIRTLQKSDSPAVAAEATP
jgi:mono/diheme cytochrome c family protein